VFGSVSHLVSLVRHESRIDLSDLSATGGGWPSPRWSLLSLLQSAVSTDRPPALVSGRVPHCRTPQPRTTRRRIARPRSRVGIGVGRIVGL